MSDHFSAVANFRALCAKLKIHPLDRGGLEPLGHTMVTCTSPYHGVEVYYFDVEQYTEHFMAVTGPMWVNGYTIIAQPMQ